MKAPPRAARPPQRGVVPANAVPRRLAIVAGALLVLFAIWIVRPSPAARVANLDSPGTTIVAFGDSLTSGVGAPADHSYPSQLEAKLGIEILNAGRSGDTSEAALARIDQDVLAHDPRIVMVGLGGNDFLRSVPIAETEENLREVVRRITDGGAMVVLLGFRFPSLNARYEEVYARLADEQKCLLVPDVLDGILSDPALRSDPIHPNAKGYAILTERLEGPLEDLIAPAGRARR